MRFPKHAPLALIPLLFLSCPSPIEIGDLDQVKDITAPSVTILSPSAGASCPAVVAVNGVATDVSGDAGGAGKIVALSWAVDASVVSGEATVAADGTFGFAFDTTTLGESFTLRVTALDWNGNLTSVPLPLKRVSGNGIPSFAAAGGNRAVTLSWEPIPRSAGYTLYYTADGSLPSPENGIAVTDVQPGHSLSPLENGRRYIFQLRSEPEPGWPESVSGFVETIPLCGRTLATRAAGEADSIRVEWDAIPGTGTFDLYRSTSRDGYYASYVRGHAGTSFVDAQVEADSWYYYRVRPSSGSTLLGDASGARSYAFHFYEPVLLSSTEPVRHPTGIALHGTTLVEISDGMYLYDIHDRSMPGTPEGLWLYASPEDIAIDGDLAYVSVRDYGLKIVDLGSSPPSLLGGTPQTWGDGCKIACHGAYAYLADGFAGFRIVSVANPASPTIVWQDAGLYAIDVVVDYPYAYVSADGLRIYDITTPASPVLLGSMVPENRSGVIGVIGNHVYYSYRDATPPYRYGLWIIDVSDPANPVLAPDTADSRSRYESPGEIMDMEIRGPFIHLAEYDRGVEVLDASNPAYPHLISRLDTPGWASAIAVEGGTLAVNDDGRLLLFDASSPELASPLAKYTIAAHQAFGVAVYGNLAYLVQWNNRLDIFDISTPSAPVPVGSYTQLDYPFCIALGGTLACIGQEYSMEILDVSDPAAPTLVGSLETDGVIYDIDLKGEFAYLADENYGVQVVDISDPGNPVLVKAYDDISDNMYDLEIEGDLAYCAYAMLGLQILDVSDPSSPTVAGSLTLPDDARSIDVQGSYAYIGDESGTMYIVDVSEPRSPAVVSTIQAGSQVFDIQVDGEYAYLSVTNMGVMIVDVADPLRPFILDSYDVGASNTPRGILAGGRYLYIATADTFEIMELTAR